MVKCPKCDAVIDVEEDELDEGEALSCDECGATINVVSVDPLELETADDDDEDDEDDDFDDGDDDDDEEEDDDDEEEEDDEDWK